MYGGCERQARGCSVRVRNLWQCNGECIVFIDDAPCYWKMKLDNVQRLTKVALMVLGCWL